MAQVDYTISNAPGSSVRSDLNDTFEAVVTLNAGATAPTSTFSNMLWCDTSLSPSLVKIRNDADDGWRAVFSSSGAIRCESGSVASPGHTYAGDENTGGSNPAPDTYVID